MRAGGEGADRGCPGDAAIGPGVIEAWRDVQDAHRVDAEERRGGQSNCRTHAADAGASQFGG